MRITHTGPDSLTARHVPWVYWLIAALLFVATLKATPTRLDRPAMEWVEALFPLAVALVLLLLWGPVVQLDIDRRRRRVVLKRWGLLGLRMRVFPLDKVTALYMEQHTSEGRLTLYRMVLMDGAQQLVTLTPFSLVDLGLNRTAQQMHDYINESRGLPPVASFSRP